MKLKQQNIKVGTLVVFNELPDATVFEVTKRDGFSIMVREAGTSYAEHCSDVSLCHAPRFEQAAA